MDYQKQIDQIVQEAVTSKTFSLEIIDKIKELKSAFAKAQEDIKLKDEMIVSKSKLLNEFNDEVVRLKKVETEYNKRKAELVIEEKKAEKLNYELVFQKERANEIKELFSLVFRNPVILKNKMVGHAVSNSQGGGYTTSTNDTETESTT